MSSPRDQHRPSWPIRRHLASAVALVLPLAAPACLDRPVAPQQPSTSRVHTVLYRSAKVEKIDLLFMIDNSASMGDKQKILARAVPDLVSRLTQPSCIDTASQAPVPRDPQTNACPAGSEPEFEPIRDIHIGMITSSLGGHGSDQCVDNPISNPYYSVHQEDMGHLISRNGSGGSVPTYENKGYLQWDPGSQLSPPGISDPTTLTNAFTEIVAGAGEDGCGFEASLEAWYRFLVDPAPYSKMIPGRCFEGDTSSDCRVPEGIDHDLLQQRADFLRNDSLLAVIMLTDEDDCSVMDGAQNYFALQDKDGTQDWHRARPTDECAVDPNDPECTSCWYADVSKHPECADPRFSDPAHEDPINLRCFNQKRRYGVSWLYPIRRYVDGLTQKTLPGGALNPVFCSKYADQPDPDHAGQTIPDTARCATAVRPDGMVFLGGILGVPWQDVARNPQNLGDGYLPAEKIGWTANEFESAGEPVPPGVDDTTTLWNVMLGNIDKDTLEIDPNGIPLDPLMIESIDPRQGVNPATGSRLVDTPVAPDSPDANPINGFDRAIPDRADLQYACAFTLPEPVDCTTQTCDCNGAPENPLCWNPDTASFGTKQFKAKAYPGARQLAVLKGLGSQAIVASICPANLRDADPSQPGLQAPDDIDWGYRPAVTAIVDRLKGALQGACWDQQLSPNDAGEVPCVVIEATKGMAGDDGQVVCPPCEGAKKPASERAVAALQDDETYQLSGYDCACEIVQADPESGALQACIEQSHPDSSVQGWCYVDPSQHPGADAALVTGCPADRKRMIRFVGDVLTSGGLTYLQCRGAALQDLGSK